MSSKRLNAELHTVTRQTSLGLDNVIETILQTVCSEVISFKARPIAKSFPRVASEFSW